MSIKLKTLVEDGHGTVAKVVVIRGAHSYELFQKLVRQGMNLYPDMPAEMKVFADIVCSGKVHQDYKAQEFSKAPKHPLLKKPSKE